MILFVTILAFALMIFIHELGHYWTARRFGVGIEKFSIGFGKPIFQFQRMFSSDANLHGGKRNYRWHHNVAHNETVWGGVFYPWHGKLTNVPMEMIPYFVTCHVNSHTVLNYIDAVQSIGLPGDPCPMTRYSWSVPIRDGLGNVNAVDDRKEVARIVGRLRLPQCRRAACSTRRAALGMFFHHVRPRVVQERRRSARPVSS